MALGRTFPIDSGFPNALDLRRIEGAIVIREGVFPDSVTTAAAGVAYGNGGWAVGARPFVFASRRGTVPSSMTYGTAYGYNDAAGTAWTIAAAPGSGSRIDLLWVRLTDPSQGEAASGSDGPSGAARAVPIYGVTAGTAATTPVAPALPAGAVEIARVTTPAGAGSIAGSTIVQSYAFAAVTEATAYFRLTAELLAWTANTQRGQVAYSLENGWTYDYDGTSWAPISSPWTSWAPTWVGTIGNGTLVARYRYIGRKTVAVEISIVWGSTSNGGTGAWIFGLPPGVTLPSSEQVVTAKAYTAGNLNWAGIAVCGGSAITPFLPQNSGTSALAPVSNSSNGSAGTGSPTVSGQYTFESAGRNLVIGGVLEVA